MEIAACCIIIVVILNIFILKISFELRMKKSLRYVVVPFNSDTKKFRFMVNSCYWDQKFAGETSGYILILLNMDDFVSSNVDIAKTFEQKHECIKLVNKDELSNYIKIKH